MKRKNQNDRKRDIIYYDYVFKNKRPKSFLWLLYCKIRKLITISESPSKVMIYEWRDFWK